MSDTTYETNESMLSEARREAGILRDALAESEKLRVEAEATISRLNRRCQSAESAAVQNVEECRRSGVSLGRALANWAAETAEEKVAAWTKCVAQSSTQYREMVKALDECRRGITSMIARTEQLHDSPKSLLDSMTRDLPDMVSTVEHIDSVLGRSTP